MLRQFYRKYGKRLFDLAIAVPAALLFLPLMLIIGLIVRLRMGGPILFLQERPGVGGKTFKIRKFKTMTNACDAQGKLLADEFRLTPLGKFLRASSLDELPELFNVIIGDMSLVGPRPLKTSYLKLYTPSQSRRHSVLPGITGLAQVNGRNLLEWNKRFELDVCYVDNYSLWLDLKILCKTVVAVFERHGISAPNHCTMPDFEGSQLNEPKRTVVIGSGGHGKVVLSTLQSAGIVVDSVYDDNSELWGQTLLGVPVKGPIAELESSEHLRGVIGIGDSRIRERLAALLPLEWMTVIHSFAYVHPSVELGAGTVVCAGAVIQPDAKVGRHSVINTASSVDHDCVIGSFSNISPGSNLSGGVIVGDHCLLGTGSVVLPGVQIANEVTVGAGTTVIGNLSRGCTVVGAAPRFIHSDRKAA